ncbi:hypothetical protein AB0H29_16365 [Streptomyces thermolilacinus]
MFANALNAFEQAAVFCERWAAAGRGELPGHDGEGLREDDFGALGFEPVMAWQALPRFELACVAMLNSTRVRGQGPSREALRAAVSRVAEPAGRFFPGVMGELVYGHTLVPDVSAALLARVAAPVR